MTDRSLRLAGAGAAGLGLAAVLWLSFSGPFPLDEFCTRRHPTWVLGLFDRPRYTAVTGPAFLGAWAGLGALYLAGLWLARCLTGRTAAMLLLGVAPLTFVAVLYPGYPLLSSDVFKYVMTGRIFAVYHENPFLRVPADFPDDRFYDLVYWKAVGNAHGPIWRLFEGASALAGGERCTTAILAMKLWPALAYLATVSTLYLMLRRHQPKRAVVGTVLYAWNPLVLLEALQNGHNDVVAMLPALLAIWAGLSGRWRVAFPLLALGVLVKPLAAAFGPVLLIVALRQGQRASANAAIGIGLGAALVVLAVLPFWRGLDTLQGLERGSIFSASPAELLVIGLQTVGQPLDTAMTAARTTAGIAFVGLAVVSLLGAWRARLTLVGAAFAVICTYLLVASQWFNPWYLLWLAPLTALASCWRTRALGLAFLLLAPLIYLLQYDSTLVVPIVFLPTALLALLWRASLGWPIRLTRSSADPRPASLRVANHG
ncbi:MAG: glycosyltransferase family 39 protein [Chloroflexi bacterium]|nr:glycosyltransferase family 39 protein [Chloroflexota bacterium]